MTKVEIHVFEPGSERCYQQYVRELVRSRARYCRVSVCVDDALQRDHWRAEFDDLASIEVFAQQAELPALPFQGDMLITLSTQISPLFSAFKQTIDLVADAEEARESGRARYRFYRDRGYPLRHIPVSQLQTAGA